MQEYIDWYWSSKFAGTQNVEVAPYHICKQNWYGEVLHFLFVKNTNKNIINCGCSYCEIWSPDRLNNFVEV